MSVKTAVYQPQDYCDIKVHGGSLLVSVIMSVETAAYQSLSDYHDIKVYGLSLYYPLSCLSRQLHISLCQIIMISRFMA